jgi:hypothetical protein
LYIVWNILPVCPKSLVDSLSIHSVDAIFCIYLFVDIVLLCFVLCSVF